MYKSVFIRFSLALIAAVLMASCMQNGSSSDTPSNNQLLVQRLSCYQSNSMFPTVEGVAAAAGAMDVQAPSQSPACSDALGVGRDTPLVAMQDAGMGGMGMMDDVTGQVVWGVSDPTVVIIYPDGTLSCVAPGDVEIVACLDDICSPPLPMRCIENPKVVNLEIFPDYYYPIMVFAEPGVGIAAPECWDCFFEWEISLLIGTTRQFYARGVLETWEWVDLTDQVTWLSSAPTIANLDAAGLLTASAEGSTEVTATYQAAPDILLTSNTVNVNVLLTATLMDLYLYSRTPGGILKVGGIVELSVDAYYDPWMLEDVTNKVTWIVSNPAVASVSADGILTALTPGIVNVKAQLGDKISNEISLEVWEEVEIQHCNPLIPNRGFWEDEYNRVILETDCSTYTVPDDVVIRYTITENQPHPWGILDPCLDLVVLDGGGNIVRTLRFEGCGDMPFMMEDVAMAGAAPIYQYSTDWDMKNESGITVPAGAYTVSARFYIYYDPIVSVGIQLQ